MTCLPTVEKPTTYRCESAKAHWVGRRNLVRLTVPGVAATARLLGPVPGKRKEALEMVRVELFLPGGRQVTFTIRKPR